MRGRRPTYLAMAESREATILYRIFEMVWRRTIMRNEDGESQEGLPGLSRTTPFAIFIEEGWWPKRSRGLRRAVRISGAKR